MLAALPFPLFLLLLAAGMLLWHLRVWREAQQQELEAADRGYYGRQYVRRMQASGMMALLALAIFVGQLIPRDEHPSLFVFLWVGVVFLVGWMVLLAMADLVDSRYRLARLRDQRRVVQAQLQAELDRVRNQMAKREPPERRNGQAAE